MKRLFVGVTMLGAVAVLGGCPIYPDTGNYRVCNSYGCYDCPDNSYSGACVPWQCSSNYDCEYGYTCSASGACVAPGPSQSDAGSSHPCSGPSGCPSGSTCGQDNQCHAAGCGSVGCPSGYVCKLAGGAAQCVAFDGGTHDASTGDSAASDATSDAPSDASDASDATAGGPCNASADCTAPNATCVDGECTLPGGLCSDTTQCNVTGSACVDGICTPRCDTSHPCPTGYQCDLVRSICGVNPGPCAGSGTSSCLGGTVCVEAHCVPPCATSDAGSTCPADQVCVNGGCIPDEGAHFACKNDGQTGQLANTCADGNICLHHDCYAVCGVDAGGCLGSSAEACKDVTVAAGTFSVCAGPSNLGSDCDPATGKLCAASGAECIDGYCK
jgi:hypothetical protein